SIILIIPPITCVMHLKEAITVAVALKCLILMTATPSVEAKSCFDTSNEIIYCNIQE
ncbi:hypothetical protein ACJMK2_032951, partial [Sinanodonta woodiana]